MQSQWTPQPGEPPIGSQTVRPPSLLIAKALSNKKAQDPLTWLIEHQFGLISRSQAEGLGVSQAMLRHRIRPGGPWQRIFPGVYLTVTGTATTDQLDMAALLYAGDCSVLTGFAALRRLGLVAGTHHVTQVLIPHERRRASRTYVQVLRTSRLPARILVHGEIRFAMIPRAIADAALSLSNMRERRALVASVVQQGRCTPQMLAGELGESRLRNAGALRDILAEVAEGALSVPECDLLQLITSSGLPRPLYNPRLYLDGTYLGKPDAWWEKFGVAVEVDSREWHLSPDGWERTMQRHDLMTAAGIRVLHFSPRQIMTDPQVVVGIIRVALQKGRPVPGIRTVADKN